GLRARHLMDEMPVDIEQRRAVGIVRNEVVVPDLVVKGASHGPAHILFRPPIEASYAPRHRPVNRLTPPRPVRHRRLCREKWHVAHTRTRATFILVYFAPSLAGVPCLPVGRRRRPTREKIRDRP